jgi:Asp-tRNA(Asn)/Glu-tRNA(Gln) amidotransferase C subunit
MSQASSIPSRREFLTICGGVGIISGFFVGALYALTAASPNQAVTPEIIDQAAELAGITILPQQKEAMLSQLRDQRNSIRKVREISLYRVATGYSPSKVRTIGPTSFVWRASIRRLTTSRPTASELWLSER